MNELPKDNDNQGYRQSAPDRVRDEPTFDKTQERLDLTYFGPWERFGDLSSKHDKLNVRREVHSGPWVDR